MTSNDLWKPPRFPIPNTSRGQPLITEPVSTLTDQPQPLDFTINTLLPEIKTLAAAITTKLPTSQARHEVSTTDAIYTLQRQLIALIHTPPLSHSPLDHACSIAALMYLQSCIGDTACTFRALDIARLRGALSTGIGNDVVSVFGEMRGKEKLVWVLAFGAMCTGGEEEDASVAALRVVCDILNLQSWIELRSVLFEVLWRTELDCGGRRVWDQISSV